jgi:pSer/pThr/pTyr-binding forkhead associated (FHA) protein
VSAEASSQSLRVTVQLVDANDSRQVQAWSFDDAPVITIGRGSAETIVLADPYVSRLHVRLTHDGAGWRLESLGRSGVYIRGEKVTDVPLREGVVFRLGPTGPAMRIETEASNESRATLNFDPEVQVLLHLDRRELDAQTREVAESDYFQRLQEAAAKLRRKRQSESEAGPG